MTATLAFHIGVHKTASTWFQRVAFASHPQIVPFVTGTPADDPLLRSIVEPSDRAWSAARARDALEAGLARLAPRADQVVVVSAERLSGHIVSGGHDALRIADRIHELTPDARVLWLTRDPSALLESEYRQLVGDGYCGTLDDLRNRRGWKMPAFDASYYDFAALAAHYRTRFGPERVAVWDYDAFVADQRTVLAEIATFLGVAPWSLPAARLGEIVHPGLPPNAVGIVRRLNRVRRSELNPYPLVNLGSWWRGPVVRVARQQWRWRARRGSRSRAAGAPGS